MGQWVCGLGRGLGMSPEKATSRELLWEVANELQHYYDTHQPPDVLLRVMARALIVLLREVKVNDD